MGSLIVDNSFLAKGKNKKNIIGINAEELILRLRSLTNECNIEMIQLAIESMVDEVVDAMKTTIVDK